MEVFKQNLRVLAVSVTILTSLQSVGADNISSPLEGEAPKTYTAGPQQDYTATPSLDAEKGATVLLWSRSLQSPKAEVKIFRKDESALEHHFFSDRNFLHMVAFFGISYVWQVRYLDQAGKPISNFSKPAPFQVVRHRKVIEALAQEAKEIEKQEEIAKEAEELEKIEVIAIEVPKTQGGGSIEVLSPQPKSIKYTLIKAAEASERAKQSDSRTPSSATEASVRKKVPLKIKRGIAEKELFSGDERESTDFAY